MNKFALFVASLLVSVSSFAQWSKPAAPAVAPLAVGEELYLYNKDAGAFFVGANDWGTRASVSETAGHKVILVQSEEDANSYLITNAAEASTTFLPMYIKGDGIWVDESGNNVGDDLFTFEALGGNTYKIGFSALNTTYNPTDYPDAYLGLIPSKNDTRIYMCDPENSEGYTMAECQLTWYFVTAAEYTTRIVAMAQYNAAVALGESIEKAEKQGNVNADVLKAAKEAYANTSSTAAAMEQLKKSLDIAIFHAQLDIATVENPVEVLAPLGIATDFNDSDFTGWTSTTGATNKQASNGNNAKDYEVTGNHYENWNWDAFAIGKVTATATDLPTGVYHLNALAFANVTGGTYLYAGENQTLVTATQIDIEQPTDVYAIVADGKLEIGLDVQVKGPNWIGLDNVHLYYLNASYDAYKAMKDATIAAEPDYESQLKGAEIACQKSVYEAYKAAIAGLNDIQATGQTFPVEEAKEKFAAFNAAAKTMASSVAAYAVYLD